jgi:hypothetical protein
LLGELSEGLRGTFAKAQKKNPGASDGTGVQFGQRGDTLQGIGDSCLYSKMGNRNRTSTVWRGGGLQIDLARSRLFTSACRPGW